MIGAEYEEGREPESEGHAEGAEGEPCSADSSLSESDERALLRLKDVLRINTLKDRRILNARLWQLSSVSSRGKDVLFYLPNDVVVELYAARAAGRSSELQSEEIAALVHGNACLGKAEVGEDCIRIPVLLKENELLCIEAQSVFVID